MLKKNKAMKRKQTHFDFKKHVTKTQKLIFNNQQLNKSK